MDFNVTNKRLFKYNKSKKLKGKSLGLRSNAKSKDELRNAKAI